MDADDTTTPGSCQQLPSRLRNRQLGSKCSASHVCDRHGVARPYRIYKVCGETDVPSDLLLHGPVSETNDFVGQLASRQDFLQNRAVLEVARRLHWDPGTKQPKTGAASKGRQPGAIPRFTDVLQQFVLTYDLHSLAIEDLVDLLPRESQRWESGFQAQARQLVNEIWDKATPREAS